VRPRSGPTASPQVNLNTVLIVVGIVASILSGFRWVNQISTDGAKSSATVLGKLDTLTAAVADLRKRQDDEALARTAAVAKMESKQESFEKSWDAWQKLQLYERADLLVALSKAGVKLPVKGVTP
jgi:hypothetical protein